MEELKVVEEKGLQDVLIFRICENEAVAAYSLDEAIDWYKDLTGLPDDDLYSYEDIEVVSRNTEVRKGEDYVELITVQEIVESYWQGKPFIVFSS